MRRDEDGKRLGSAVLPELGGIGVEQVATKADPAEEANLAFFDVGAVFKFVDGQAHDVANHVFAVVTKADAFGIGARCGHVVVDLDGAVQQHVGADGLDAHVIAGCPDGTACRVFEFADQFAHLLAEHPAELVGCIGFVNAFLQVNKVVVADAAGSACCTSDRDGGTVDERVRLVVGNAIAIAGHEAVLQAANAVTEAAVDQGNDVHLAVLQQLNGDGDDFGAGLADVHSDCAKGDVVVRGALVLTDDFAFFCGAIAGGQLICLPLPVT